MTTTPEKPPTESGLLRLLTTLGDMARLRLLRVVEREELSVGELSRVLQLPQSTVSRHLKLLHDGGWVIKRSEGTASLYRVERESLSSEAQQLWALVRGGLGASPTLEHDDLRLAEVVSERRADSKAFFGRVAGDWDRLRRELFGQAFTAEAFVSLLDADWVVADLGCGTGSTAEYLAPAVRRVIAVDREPAMLDAARQRLASFDNLEFRQDDLADLSIDDGVVDVAIVSLVMVYMPDPQRVVKEIARILRPGGRLMILDMVAHDRQSYRHTMGHQHLGFAEAAVRKWASAAGFVNPRYRRLRPDTAAKGPGLFVATMQKEEETKARRHEGTE